MKNDQPNELKQSPAEIKKHDKYADGWTYRKLLINCGDKKCRTCRGRKYAHGPYWYAEKKITKGKKEVNKTKYIGKNLKSVTEKDADLDRKRAHSEDIHGRDKKVTKRKTRKQHKTKKRQAKRKS